MLRRLIDKVATVFTAAMGTETAFGISCVLAVIWLAMAPIMGLSHWNATLGLGGNTTESTGEWFLGIAMLIKANQIHDTMKEGD